jgi:hypothetical protein
VAWAGTTTQFTEYCESTRLYRRSAQDQVPRCNLYSSNVVQKYSVAIPCIKNFA